MIKTALLILTGILAFFALILPDTFSESAYPMSIGEASPQDILAPYSLTFESDVLTEQARQAAADSVSPIYLQTDPSIGRHQAESLQTVLYYITTVRQDEYATLEQKISDIQSIDNLALSEESITRILQLS